MNPHLHAERVGNPEGKPPLKHTQPTVNHDLPVIGSLVHRKISALDHVVTEAGFCEEPSEKNSILNPYGPLIEPESGTTLLKEKPECESSSSQSSVPVAQSDSLDMSCEVSNTFGLVTNKSQQSGELPTSTSIEPTGGPSTSFSLCDATATCDPTEKTTLSSPERDSNLALSALGSKVQHKTNTLDYYFTKADPQIIQ
uniref:Uncharacterized protein n=1 Tax=Timema cristinae TaxID=61476 RepID=A0A7R9HAK6_TIMCR|nr:unnamed protein product [Timema cristinae]